MSSVPDYSAAPDSGFQHSAFVLRAEGRLDRTSLSRTHIPRGELVELLSKALLYAEAESHWRGSSYLANCKAPFSVLQPHVCDVEDAPHSTRTFVPAPIPPETAPSFSSPNTNGSAEKRKADAATVDSSRKEKRARTEEMIDLDSVASSIPPTKASSPMPSTPAELPIPASQRSHTLSADTDKSPDSTATDRAVNFLEGHKTEVFLCSWNPVKASSLASGSKDTVINIWNVPDDMSSSDTENAPMQLAYLPKTDQGDLTSLDWNPTGTLLAAGSYDAILRICDDSGNLYYSYDQHKLERFGLKSVEKGPIFATRFSKSGKMLLTASLDGSVCVWDVENKKLHNQYNSHRECCFDIDWISDQIFASCGADALIHIWKLDSNTPFRTFAGHTKDVNQIKCNPSRTLLASCSDDGTARIWNIADLTTAEPSSETARVLRGHDQAVSSILWCPKTESDAHEILATSSFDQTCRLWDSVTGECLHMFADRRGPIFALAFSPDARFIATGSGDGWLHIYDMKTRERKWAWHTSSDRPAIFEISWQQLDAVNRLALALESTKVGIVDISQIPALQP
ncbi:hypothetical protein EIP91_011536 [Steccherinum ochraceum]|uniref:Uncharacterized protein n=1 Tax=Steccherinum ochraceum TaxID=92696 RepID=A0A4R0RM42_9APHY|nr:hypothetical protein EIP91_011536 [Steccherinum ochraceum]